MRYLILATSGSGKSYFCRSAVGKGTGIPVVDGDNIINAQGGYPKGKRDGKEWWEDPVLKARVDATTQRLILEAMMRNKDLSVAWWASIDSLMERVGRLPKGKRDFEVVGVQVPLDVLKERWLGRNRDIEAGISGHSKRPWEHYKSHWEWAGDRMRDHRIKIYPSFEALAKSTDLYIRTRTL